MDTNRNKFRIFKSRDNEWLPWILIYPESHPGAKRRATPFGTHKSAMLIALSFVDRNHESQKGLWPNLPN